MLCLSEILNLDIHISDFIKQVIIHCISTKIRFVDNKQVCWHLTS